MSDLGEKYIPLKHPKQSFAKENHVIILFFDKDAVLLAQHKDITMIILCLSLLSCSLVAISLFFFACGSANINCIFTGIGFISLGIGCSLYVSKQRDNDTKMLQLISESYWYYCYDISDGHVKCVVVEYDYPQKIKSEPVTSNLGKLENIRQIKYYQDEDGSSFVAVKKVNGASGQRFNHKMLTFRLNKQTFAQLMTERINIIKAMNLDHIAWDYQTMQWVPHHNHLWSYFRYMSQIDNVLISQKIHITWNYISYTVYTKVLPHYNKYILNP